MKTDYVKIINDQSSPINPKLKKALNDFFNQVPHAVDGCILRRDWDGADYSLIIEESDLYGYLSGEYGWNIHTLFYDSFKRTGWFPEKQNSCVINFYKD